MSIIRKYILVIIILSGVLLRIFISFRSVFNNGYVNFPGTDSYYRAYQLKEWLIKCDIGIETLEPFIVFLPPLISGLTIYLVYLISKRLFGIQAGLISALAIAVFPGEYFARSVLGALDHHVFEVLITTVAALCFIYIFTEKRLTWRVFIYASVVLSCLFVYGITWTGASMLFSGNLGSLFSSGYSNTLGTTSEAVSALYSVNYWPGLEILLCIFCSFILWRQGYDWQRYLVITWAIFMSAATIWQVRFDYYLIVPISILAGYVGWDYFRKETLILVRFIVLAAFIVIMLPVYNARINSDFNTPSKSWNDGLLWLRENTHTNSVILAWWDYGYWIKYKAERIPYITPSQEPEKVKTVAELFLSCDYGVNDIPAGYVIVDYKSAYFYGRVMASWAGLDYNDIEIDRTLVRQLYDGNYVPGYRVVYNNSELIIFYIEEEGL